MKPHVAWPLAVVAACALTSDPKPGVGSGAQRTRPAGSGPSCVVPIDDGDVQVRVTDASRSRCVAMARLVEDSAPAISHADIRQGPPSDRPFVATDRVFCRLKPRAEQGGSLKFRCMRTDTANILYDDDGELVPQAKGFDADGNLVDAAGNAILKKSGSPREGDDLRVKYFLGSEPAERHREMFTETAVSRILWILGIPVDRVYMPAAVMCFGCSADPFGQMVAEAGATPREFALASVKRPYEGKKISVVRRRGFLGLGGKYDHGFGFDEVAELAGTSDEFRLQAELHALAFNIIGYNHLNAYQNDLICRKDQWDKQTGECGSVVAYVSDVGGTLGGRDAYMMEGDSVPDMKRYPRGDFVTFAQGRVFRDHVSCTLWYRIGVRGISETARAIMEQRIRSRIGREQLLIIFQQASFHRLEMSLNKAVAAQEELEPGPELDRAVQLLWADEVASRLDEILTTRCP